MITEQQRVGGPSPSTLSLLLYVAYTYLLHFYFIHRKAGRITLKSTNLGYKSILFYFSYSPQTARFWFASQPLCPQGLTLQPAGDLRGKSPASAWPQAGQRCLSTAASLHLLTTLSGRLLGNFHTAVSAFGNCSSYLL